MKAKMIYLRVKLVEKVANVLLNLGGCVLVA